METRLFAWWPVKVTSGKHIWLKYYFQHKILYDESTGRPPLHGLHFIWTETAQEKTWRLLRGNMIQNRNVWNDTTLTKQDKL
jgi:hypothetical protein